MYYGSDPNVHTTFTGDATLVTAAAQQATQAIDDAAAKIKARNAEIADDIDEFNNLPKATGTAGVGEDKEDPLGFKKSVTAVTSLIGKITAAVGIATGFYAIGQKIGNLFRDITPDVERFFQSIQGGSASEQLKAINKELADLQNSNQGTLANDLLNLSQGQTSAQVRRRIELLEAQRQNQELRLKNEQELKETQEANDAEIEANRQRLEAESQQKEALDRERADDEREARLRQIAEDQQRDALEKQRDLERAQLETAAKVAEAMRKAILEPLEAIRRANEQFLNTQNGNLITSIDRLRATLEATGGGGRFDGAETGFVD